MTSWRLVDLFAGVFILDSLALGAPASPSSSAGGGSPSPHPSA